MRFSCESCGSRYLLADEKVRGLLVEVRCRACGGIVTLRDGVPVASDAQQTNRFAADPAPAVAGPSAGAAGDPRAPTGATSGADEAPPVPAGVVDPGSNEARPAAAEADPASEAPPAEEAAERMWFALVAGKQHGPMPDRELEREIAAGRIVPTTFVWHDGMSDWKRLADVSR
ncbi:MAG TPA: GYF domain-containing protein [Vulgatibacter sp.]